MGRLVGMFRFKGREIVDRLYFRKFSAWLRGRRSEVPKTEEVMRNVAIMQMKRENAPKVMLENPFVNDGESSESKEAASNFPTYNEYESELPYKKQ